MRTNLKRQPIQNYEGGRAAHISPAQQLRRLVLSCLLWEDEFYQDGKTTTSLIEQTVAHVSQRVINDLAFEARTKYNLRHVPLFLLALKPDAEAIYHTISRADELTELLAIYWRNGKKPIPAQMKKGLAKAFTKFDEHALAKYNRENAIKLRDVLFMTHAKPKDEAQAELWKRLIAGTMKVPDTWEVALSSGANKKETFDRLLDEKSLGYMALLRNLRNMQEAGVDSKKVKDAILARKGGAEKLLPFRFIAAARAAPIFEKELDISMQEAVKLLPKLSGSTAIMVDVSVSMHARLSHKSDLTRLDAAAALSSIVQGDDIYIFSFSDNLKLVPPRNGMACVDAVISSQEHGGTMLAKSLSKLNEMVKYDRIIIITDEQSQDGICNPLPRSKAYLINVASNKNGVGYGQWTHIDGFSENVIRYIHEIEQEY